MRWLGLLPSETRNLASPLFLFLVWGFARGDPTWGLSVSFGFPCSVCFLLGSSPGFGARGFLPPKKWFFLQEKRETSPLVEGRVCAEWQKTLPPIFSSSTGGPSVCCVRWSNEAATANADIEADHLDVPATFGVGDVKSFWPVVSLAVCASC